MIPGPKLSEFGLSQQQRLELELLTTSGDGRRGWRAKIVLLCGDGLSNSEIARRMKTSQDVVRKWRGRFSDGSIEGLRDLGRSGRPKPDLVISEADRVVLEMPVCST